MFRKLVSNLSFSPALVGQLGFYAKRLRKEEATRRIGLIFTALALVVQSFAVFSPPEAANAANPDSIIYQSLNNKNELLAVYDRGVDSAGHSDIRQIYSHIGISRQDIVNSQLGYIYTDDFNGKINFTGRSNYGVANRYAMSIPGSSKPIYTGAWQDKRMSLRVLTGKRAVDGQWFAIMLYCGNPLYVTLPPPPPKPIASCVSLQATPLSRTEYKLSAKGAVSGGATIKAYQYIITSSGKQILNRTVPTNGTSSSINQTLAPGSYLAKVVTQTSVGNKTSVNCSLPLSVSPDPVAACSSLTLTSLSRTSFNLTAKAVANNGATVSGYTYVVKDSTGAEVLRKKVNSSDTINTLEYKFAKDGSYTVSVIVHTSLGNKTGGDCVKNLTVTPEERCPLNPDLVISDPGCQPCVDDPTIWYKDENCSAKFELAKSVENVTQSIGDANNSTAKPSDTLQYVLSVKNVGKDSGEYTIKDDLTDILEYANVVDLGGATINEDAAIGPAAPSIATWPSISLKPNESISKIITVKVKDNIPAMAQHQSATESYNCQVRNVFGDTLTVKIECPPIKVVEQVVTELPKTGPTENIIFAGVVLSVVTYFYARARQVKKEIRLIRRDLNAGTI